MSRIPSFSSQSMLSKSSEEVLETIKMHGIQYEQGFLNSLSDYIKKDSVLKNYYIRMVYECEVVKTVIEKRLEKTAPEWLITKLEYELHNMRTAKNAELTAVYDSEFHNFLFFIAGEEGFFSWFQTNSKILQEFLDSFWIEIFENKDSCNNMIRIHERILEAIKDNNEVEAVNAIQEHFSAVILILLSTLYTKEA